METDIKGEEDDGGVGDTRIAPMIIEMIRFLGTYDRACKKIMLLCCSNKFNCDCGGKRG
jgi:hypothetical protein